MEGKNKLIVHGLMKVNDKFLLIKRTEIKRGKPNSYPLYWDIPGGMVEDNELPSEALVREAKEEVNLDVSVSNIIHEDSNLDINKGIVFTRLVYLCNVLNNDISQIKLQLDEHNEYRLISELSEMGSEKIVPYLEEIFEEEKHLVKQKTR
ncbi:MAG: NUDIX hydrolase [Firmicutes bacterium]|nr:NUDIX hydrolase [Bacillota bacterium]